MKKSNNVFCSGFSAALGLSSVLAIGLTIFPAIAQQNVERVEVTGSSIKRIDAETALPVQIITREQIEATGAVSAEQFLQSVGVAMQGNSNSVAATSSGANAGNVSGVSLRGLGSQRTLVLIDGKRVAGGGTITDSTTVDVNLIPASAIERIEILKDGASAIYGSDAIGGVINFILRKDYKAGEVSVYGGRSQDGGGGVTRINGGVGWGDFATQRFNISVFANYQKENSLFGIQRPFASTAINPQYLNDTTSGNTFPGNIVPVNGSFGTRNPTVGAASTGPACPGPYSTLDPLFPQNRCRFDPAGLVSLLPQIETTSVFLNGRLSLTKDIEGYGQFSFVNKESRTIIQPVPISDQFALPANHPLFAVAPFNGFSTFLLRNTSPFYPTAFVAARDPTLPDLLVRYRSALTGNRDFTDKAESTRWVLGAKGNLGRGWDFDIAYLHTDVKLTERDNGGYPLLSQILPILNSGTVNPFGPSSAAVTSQVQATNFVGTAYATKTSLDSLSAKTTKELTDLAGGPLAIALGAEARREGFTTSPSPQIQIGDISGYGGNNLPQNKGRNVSAAFIEVNAPFLRTVEATAAARYDDYQGTGSRVSPKFGLRWQPVKQALFRGSIGSGFRAPSLTELYQPQAIGVTAQGLTDPQRCAVTGSSNDCATQFPIALGGNTALKSETSKHASVGVVFEPTNNISIGVDAFLVNLKNTIIFGVDPAAILSNQARFGSFITRGACSAADIATFAAAGLPCVGPITSINQLNQNLGQTQIRGMDFNFRWRLPTERAGTFTATLNGTHMSKYQIQQLDGSFLSVNGAVNPIVNGAGGVIPTWRHYAAVDWRRGAWNVTFAQQYQSGYKDICGTFDACPPQLHENVSRYEVFHLFGSYSGLLDKKMKITFGVRNLTNVLPPYTNAGGQSYFQSGYDPGYADPRGRFYFTSLTYKF